MRDDSPTLSDVGVRTLVVTLFLLAVLVAITVTLLVD